LLKQTSKLPVQQLREVINFTEFLASKAVAAAVTNGKPAHALKSFVGGVNHGSIASGIDEELYEALVR